MPCRTFRTERGVVSEGLNVKTLSSQGSFELARHDEAIAGAFELPNAQREGQCTNRTIELCAD
ncbi:hypothetical protein BURKHO8Y_60117 [Burkholderia sp. 8Y]|nr:hypothetical protein BURKHO8Y_60117 [Burkholderia sp. 8Y]